MYQLSQKKFSAHVHHNNTIFSISFNHQPISKQSSLKYLGIALDDKLSWKLQIEKLNDTTLQIMWMYFKLKHCTSYVQPKWLTEPKTLSQS